MRTAVAVIPARFGAQRFPGKPLHPIAGVPMVVRVWERALQARVLSSVLVATDDERIVRAIEGAGGHAVLTPSELPSGTDRVFAAVEGLPVPAEVVLNVQGDEPLIDPGVIEAIATFLIENPGIEMATAAIRMRPEDADNPNVVKVVSGNDGCALYFSRSVIPYRRNPVPELPAFKHLGIYGYQREALARLTSLPPHALERAESLEQLRALAAGMKIKVLESERDSIGVDSPEDARRVEALLTAGLGDGPAVG
ncbi:MAG: 3-deoxy-manno-octulosonate cytidylyltransferase [Acidobacteria bacterium]|nr:3-deoxy-manno-octulosonate cytidylyltransferase [Acidobacteriota bacterium]MCK6681649.1 3-deoxy-manno-octulosonate cytidylyltransferase [Thermoanaerobaculia bacterium]